MPSSTDEWMMKVFLRAAALLAPVLALPADLPAQSRTAADSAWASVIEAERAFARHSLRLDTQGAFTTYLSGDALLYRPRVVRAAAYLRARPMSERLVMTWEPIYGDVSSSGDFAWTTGPWIAGDRRQPEVNPSFGQYARVWRRQANGAWKVEVEAGVPHEADSIGPKKITRAAASQWRRAASESAAARTLLLRTDSLFARAADNNGAAAAFRQRAGPQMRLLRKGRFPLLGADASAYLKATDGYSWRPVAARVSSAGDLGYTYGVYAVTTGTGPARRATETGDYLRIWRRTASGDWRVVLDLASPAQ
jgi:ketosteroid isomerase-like protein